MYFLYRKDNGKISLPVKHGEPSRRALNKESNCEIGSGIKWQNVDLFYAPDGEFPEDFQKWAATGKYYVDGSEIKENLDWIEPEEPEW
jgi:hypothetical protein